MFNFLSNFILVSCQPRRYYVLLLACLYFVDNRAIILNPSLKNKTYNGSAIRGQAITFKSSTERLNWVSLAWLG